MTTSSLLLVLIALYCWALGSIIFAKNMLNRINILFFLFTGSIGLWIFLFSITYSSLFSNSYTLFLTRILTIPAFFYPWFFLLLAKTFPENSYRPSKFSHFLNGGFTLFFLLNLFSSHYISSAYIESGLLFFKFGYVYVIFGIYCSVVMLYGSKVLLNKLWKFQGQTKQQVLFVVIGAILSILAATFFSVILPLLGLNQYNLFSPACAIFLITFWFFSILKYRLMDITIVVRKVTSYALLFFLVITSLFLTHFTLDTYFTNISKVWPFGVLTLAWAFIGQKTVREGLITTTKRTFIKGYYDQEKVFNDLSKKISKEQSRKVVIESSEITIDEHFNFEETAIVYAERDRLGEISGYTLQYRPPIGDVETKKLKLEDDLIFYFEDHLEEMRRMKELPQDMQSQLRSFKFKDAAIILPLRSLEGLEGLLILGERSGGLPIKQTDEAFLKTLRHYINAILFGLTPLEKAEQKYVETKKKEHDSEKRALVSDRIKTMSEIMQEYNHEIRTPLQVIMANIYQIPDKDEWRRYRQNIIDSADNIEDIVTTTLKLSQEMAEYKRIETEIDVKGFLEEALRKFPFPEGVTVALEVKEEENKGLHFKGVAEDLKKVMNNLLQNAVDAMPQSRLVRTITVRAHEESEEVVITVSDTGAGIPKVFLKDIWTPFKSSHVTKGRGLGLSIVFRLISEHGGNIEVATTEGVGTTFTMRFPK